MALPLRVVRELGLAAAVAAAACAPPVATGPAPEFRLPDASGAERSLSDYRGKVILLDFWATWCLPCLEELPDLKALHEEFQGRGFTVLGVSLDEDAELLPPFIKENKIPYPILRCGPKPPAGYRLPGIPTAYLLSRDGVILRSYFGPKSHDALARDVTAALKPTSR